MLKWRVNEIIAAHQTATGNRLTQQAIAEGTGLARTTVAKIVNGDGGRVDLGTIDSLLNYLSAVTGRKVGPGELFQYTYDGEYALSIGLPKSR